MNYVMITKACIIVVIGLVLYVFLMKRIIGDGHQLNANYMESVYRYALKYNASNVVDSIREVDFLYMINDGANPCDLKENIQYVDYIGECSLYIERKSDDRND